MSLFFPLQFLDLCTFKLGLPKAARKLFTMNGELIIDMSQLLQPYYPELCLPLSKSSIYDAKVSMLICHYANYV